MFGWVRGGVLITERLSRHAWKQILMAMELSEAADLLNRFAGPDLRTTVAKIEASLKGQTYSACQDAIVCCGAKNDVMAAAALMKRVAGQINVVIHALGILRCLPHILKTDEV